MVTIQETPSVQSQCDAAARLHAPYDHSLFFEHLTAAMATMHFHPSTRQQVTKTFASLCNALDACLGATLQERWQEFEQRIWPVWLAGRERPPGKWWTGAVRIAVTARLVQPGWDFLCTTYTATWIKHVSEDDPLTHQFARLEQTLHTFSWATPQRQLQALNAGLRLILAYGYESLQQITEQDLLNMPSAARAGSELLDAALCALEIFSRTPEKTVSRRTRLERRSPAEMVATIEMPEQFRQITALYLETYAIRTSSAYGTLQHKVRALARFWRFMTERYPEVHGCSEILPLHARAFVPYAIEQSRYVQRKSPLGRADRTTANEWLIDVRTFFADICTWAAEGDSPFARFAPRTIPLTRHDLMGVGFEQARKRSQAQLTSTILDLEREIPNIRAYALRHWTEAEEAHQQTPSVPRLQTAARDAFWDWAVLELLVQSGLRVEEESRVDDT